MVHITLESKWQVSAASDDLHYTVPRETDKQIDTGFKKQSQALVGKTA